MHLKFSLRCETEYKILESPKWFKKERPKKERINGILKEKLDLNTSNINII